MLFLFTFLWTSYFVVDAAIDCWVNNFFYQFQWKFYPVYCVHKYWDEWKFNAAKDNFNPQNLRCTMMTSIEVATWLCPKALSTDIARIILSTNKLLPINIITSLESLKRVLQKIRKNTAFWAHWESFFDLRAVVINVSGQIVECKQFLTPDAYLGYKSIDFWGKWLITWLARAIGFTRIQLMSDLQGQ